MDTYLWPVSMNLSFVLFSAEHICTLIIIAILGVCPFLFQKQLRQALFARRTLRYFFAAILLLGEAGYQIWTLSIGTWSVKSSLPLEVSDLAALLTAVMLLTKRWPLFSILYFAGIGGAVQALLTPDLGRTTFPHFHYIQFFATHGTTVIACLFMIVAERFTPTYRSLWVAFGVTNLYGVMIFFFDRLIGANYLYLMHKPSISVLNFLGSWPWYLLWTEVLAIVEFHILYSPFYLWKKREKAKEERRKSWGK